MVEHVGGHLGKMPGNHFNKCPSDVLTDVHTDVCTDVLMDVCTDVLTDILSKISKMLQMLQKARSHCCDRDAPIERSVAQMRAELWPER